MKQTIYKGEFRDQMKRFECGFSYEGAGVLFDYLDDETDNLDPVAVRCSFCEYESATEAILDIIVDSGVDSFPENEQEFQAFERLNNLSCLVAKLDNGGVIINTDLT